MRYFLDTEFIEDGRTIELLSIGIVSEDDREYYAENSDAQLYRANDWVKENVIPHLHTSDIDVIFANGTKGVTVVPDHRHPEVKNRATIGLEVISFVGSNPEFWGYYADYDWVAVAQLFGTMMDLPVSWPMFCMDLKQLAVSLGNPKLPEQTKDEHHALADARWNKSIYDHLWRIYMEGRVFDG